MEEKSKIKLNTKAGLFGLTIDIIMIVIVIVNLVFLIFDWSFDNLVFQGYVKNVSEDFFVYYRDVIHSNFAFYESIFITIFITELLLQWVISILYKNYPKWWFYPLIHWYDVLGCVPLGTFAWLRLFRIVAMTFRLHKRGVVNLKKTVIYRQAYSTYEIFVHDVTDRALIELIESVQRGVKSERDENILAYGIKPDQSGLAKELSSKLHEMVKSNYTQHRDDMKEQIELVIKDGFDKSEEMKKLGHIPFIGSSIANKLEDMVSDITFQLTDSLTNKLASDEVAQILENIINTSLDSMLSEKSEIGDKTDNENQLGIILTNILDRMLQKLIDDINNDRKKRIKIFNDDENTSEKDESTPKLNENRPNPELAE